VTIDEELNLLDQQLRRLKIEYEIFFNNPAKRPPTDVEWKVLSLIRKFSDGARMSFSNPLQVQRDGAALRGFKPSCGARKCGFGKRATAGQRMRSSRCKACACPKSMKPSIIRCMALRATGPSRGRRGRSAFLGAVFRSGGRAGAG